MIFLLTGQPGHGKTARGMELALNYVKQGRQVYVHGVRKLDHAKAGFLVLDDPTKWQDLPDGSVVVLDECYTHFPKRAAGKPIPDHVEALARHRHRGFDFVMICQKGDQLDSFIQGFIEQHTHVVRKWGFVRLRQFDRYMGNPNVKCDDNRVWRRPKRVFELYESTVLDTTKARIPMWAIWLGVCLALLALGTWYMQHRYATKIEESRALSAAQQGSASDTRGTRGAGAVTEEADDLRQTDYVAYMTPRVEGKPWTAPAFDGFDSTRAPDLYCMSTADSCTCLTEQGTRYMMEMGLCRTIARDGNYNPTRQQAQVASAPKWEPMPAPAQVEQERVWGDNFVRPPPPPPGVYVEGRMSP